MSIVALIRCESYDYLEVKNAVERGFQLLGGPDKFARTNEKILLKPNFLAGDPPEKCTNTHFAVFKAVSESLKKTGAIITYGDSPGFGSAKSTAVKCGIYTAAQEVGIELVEFTDGEDIFFKEGIQNRKFTIAKPVLASDGIISLPKFKTHGLTLLTGAIKNQFGCVPGYLKGEYHVKLADPDKFAQMLVDLNKLIKPRLFIMDGIIAMEGNGPRGGKPHKMNALLFSTDPVALDATVCRMVKVNPELIPSIRYGRDQGLGVCSEDEIKIVGDSLKGFISADFDIRTESRTPSSGFKQFINNLLMKLLGNLFVQKPYIISDECVKCGICVTMCPVNPKAVDWHDGDKTKPPSYKYEQCIKCYCCQEVCPEGAIELKVPFLRRLFLKTRR